MEKPGLPQSIIVLNYSLLPVVVISSIAHGLVVLIRFSKKYGDGKQVTILYACVSVIDIFNMILQTLLLPILNLRYSWLKIIILYFAHSVEYMTVYLTFLIASHFYCGVSRPFKYREYVSAGKRSLLLQLGFIATISLILSPVFNAYESLLVQESSTTNISICYSLSYPLEITKRSLLSEYEEMFIMQIIPLLTGFFLAVRATHIFWIMKTPLQQTTSFLNTNWEKKRQENRNKGLQIIAVLITISVAILPRTFLNVLKHCNVRSESNFFYLLSTVLYFVRFPVNPIIYYFLGKDFPHGIRTIFRSWISE